MDVNSASADPLAEMDDMMRLHAHEPYYTKEEWEVGSGYTTDLRSPATLSPELLVEGDRLLRRHQRQVTVESLEKVRSPYCADRLTQA
jgi:hypothetical protein